MITHGSASVINIYSLEIKAKTSLEYASYAAKYCKQ